MREHFPPFCTFKHKDSASLSQVHFVNIMRVRLGIIVLLLAGLSALSAATPDILKQFKAIYNKPDANCTVCHTKPPKRNPFGKAIEDALNKTSDFVLTKEVMKPLESLDSYGDGFSNIDEINAGTGPGDPTSKPAASTSAPAAGSTDKKDSPSGLIPGHSFHPALVHFPIALLAIAALLEGIAIFKKNEFMHSASIINLAMGLITATGAIATGVAAWLRLGYKLEGTLLIHLILASASILIGIFAYAQRDKKAYLPLIALSGLLVMIAGHFGGTMVYG